ncbi:unnamed protein product, partial [Mesorhabditis belari]|uniref:Transmembrane protein n=1 Tax=Mesorhabditis belari TaxID=2138241 RepID=A0AAF3EM03_9BILA
MTRRWTLEDICVAAAFFIGCSGVALLCTSGCKLLNRDPDSKRGWLLATLGFLAIVVTICATIGVIFLFKHIHDSKPLEYYWTRIDDDDDAATNSTGLSTSNFTSF